MSDMRGDKRGTERKIVLDNLKKNPNICLNTVYSLSAIVKKWFFSFVLPRNLLFRSKYYFRFVKKQLKTIVKAMSMLKLLLKNKNNFPLVTSFL
jgi:hypothetical protein